jgi:hypothetical protein
MLVLFSLSGLALGGFAARFLVGSDFESWYIAERWYWGTDANYEL